MTDKTTAKCQARVYRGPWGAPGRCSRRATVDGKWCKQHSPEAKAARDAARQEMWEAERKESAQRFARQRFDQVCGDIAREFGIKTPEELRGLLSRVLPPPPQTNTNQ